MLVIVWALYTARVFVFSNCPVAQRTCVAADYFNDPGNAIAHGATAANILSIVNGDMYYTRVPRSNDCTPGADQTVHILNPQWCLFSGTGGDLEAKAIKYGSNVYQVPDTSLTVTTIANCIPQQPGLSGAPILRWDPNVQPLMG